jgi:hypothetical protein
MKIEDHFKETLNRAIANEPPVLDAWERFESRAGRARRVRLSTAFAAGIAVIVAAALVVPKLGTKEIRVSPATQPPSQTPTQTADPYANFTSVQDQSESWILRYPQGTWKQSQFEGVTYFQPNDAEPAMKGGPTVFISLQLRDEPTCPPPREFQQVNPTWKCGERRDGRAFYVADSVDSETFVRTYGFDWTKPCAEGASCTSQPRTLLVIMRGDTAAHWDEYLEDAKLIVLSIEYSDSAAG